MKKSFSKRIFILIAVSLLCCVAIIVYFGLNYVLSVTAEDKKDMFIKINTKGAACVENTKDDADDRKQQIAQKSKVEEYDFTDDSHWNLTVSAWEKLSEKDYSGVITYTDECLKMYEKQAKEEAKKMRRFSGPGHEDDYALVNDVATSHYILGEMYMRQEKYPEAIDQFNIVIAEYPYAQCWDPKGWFWKVSEISKKNIDKIEQILKAKQ